MMRAVMRPVAVILWTCWAGFIATPAQAQSQNAQALRWYRSGVEAGDPAVKIEAFQAALALDSLFVEAHYALGLAYKQQQDYAAAERHLGRAHALKPDHFKPDQQGRLLYELAALHRRAGRLPEGEQALRAAAQITVDKKLQTLIALDLGRLLLDQRRHDEAIAVLREGEKREAENKTYFRNLIALAEEQAALEQRYAQARQAETAERWSEAQTLFQELLARDRRFADVAVRAARVDSQIQAINARSTTNISLLAQAEAYEREGKLALALAVYENLLAQPGDDAEVRSRLEQSHARVAQQLKTEKLEQDYAEGMAALQQRNWPRALLAFERVNQSDPNFQDVAQKLQEVQAGLQRESTESVCARYYAEGLAAWERNDLGGSLAAFEKVSSLNPNYRDVAQQLEKVERTLHGRTEPAPVVVAPAPEIQRLMDEALAAMSRGDWVQAVAALEAAQMLQPDSREVAGQLAAARAGLQQSLLSANAGTAWSQPFAWWVTAGLALTLGVAVVLGFLFFSPAARARYYLLRGNHAEAAKIYERMLVTHPERVKADPELVKTLSSHYLLAGKVQEQALPAIDATPPPAPVDGRDEAGNAARPVTAAEAIDLLESRLKSRH